jgi:hypothetical protein
LLGTERWQLALASDFYVDLLRSRQRRGMRIKSGIRRILGRVGRLTINMNAFCLVCCVFD